MFGGASSFSGKVDAVFLYIAALTIAFLVFITFVMITFVIRYRRGKGGKPEDIHGHTLLELLWTGIPLVLFLSMFYYGWTNYRYLREVPRDAMVITVTARQWAGSFTYPNGRQTSELFVALGRPVRLDLKFLQRHAALGLEAHVDDGYVLLDGHDAALDDDLASQAKHLGLVS